MPCSRAAAMTATPVSRGRRSKVRQEPSASRETSSSDAPSRRLSMHYMLPAAEVIASRMRG